MRKMTVKCTFIDELLGSSPSDEEIYTNYIASKAPDAETMTEELEAISVDEMMDKKMTIFYRDKAGNPCIKNHQIMGFFKGSCGALQRAKGEASSKESCKIKAYKKTIDTGLMVIPKMIRIQNASEMGNYERPKALKTNIWK